MEGKECEGAPTMEIQVSDSSLGWKDSYVKKCKGCCDIWLPLEVQSNILAKLPSKALVRCQCVSKEWLAEIRNVVFSKMLSSQIFNDKANSSTQVILVRPLKFHVLVIDLSRQKVVKTLVHHHPIRHKLEPIGSCNGLLCLLNCSLRQIQVYNPETSASRVIDIPRVTFGGKVGYNFYGFGYDCRSNDYKILKMPYTTETQPMLFSFKNNSWKLVQSCPFDYSSEINWECMVPYSNVLHWVPVFDPSSTYVPPSKIICFDLENENYYELPKPGDIGDRIKRWHLVVVRGLLHFVHFNYEKNELDIWVMEVYSVKESWNKWIHISLKELCRTLHTDERLGPNEWSIKQSKPFVYSEDGKKIIIAVGRRVCCFVAFDLITRESKIIATHLWPKCESGFAKFTPLSWASSQVSPNSE